MNPIALLIAQTLGEYGSLGGALAGGISRIRMVIEGRLSAMDRKEWAIVLGGLFLLWIVFRRRR